MSCHSIFLHRYTFIIYFNAFYIFEGSHQRFLSIKRMDIWKIYISSFTNIKSRKFNIDNEMKYVIEISLISKFSLFVKFHYCIWFFKLCIHAFLQFLVRLIDFTNTCRCMQYSSIGRWSINKVHVAGEIKDSVFVTILKCQKRSSTRVQRWKVATIKQYC